MDEQNALNSNFIHDFIDEDLAAGVNTRVQTRFPPEPNGYLHIGHAKAICIDFATAEKYGGICNLRLDDTNPSKEDVEYVESIQEDIAWLGFKWANVYYASEYFDFIYECAIKLIKDGKAYVDDLTPEQMREYRGTLTEPGKNSPYRDRSVEENLDLFARMTAGEFADGEKVLRAKIDMASPNMNMRDPAIYRIMHVRHHHTGDKWCVYPMYDFAHPLSDAKEGVTYSLCSLEFENHRPLYDWFIQQIGFEEPPRQIAYTAGVDGAVIIQKIKEGKGDFGYNARTGEYVQMYEAGVIDPTKVARVALENAAGVAGMFLTTECGIVDIPEPTPAAPAMPAGGMM